MRREPAKVIAAGWLIALLGCAPLSAASPGTRNDVPASVPFVLDHNRMLVEAEFRRKDGSWRKARLWVDTGAPDFFMSARLARDLGIDLPAVKDEPESGRVRIPPPSGVRIGGVSVSFDGVESSVLYEPFWLLSTMPIEANLPARVLQRYNVVLDYPARRFILAEPGSLQHRGRAVTAAVNRETGVVQIDAAIGGMSLSLALDNGASYSFVSENTLEKLLAGKPGMPRMSGAAGCANIWGWWPGEATWTVARVPEIRWGSLSLEGVGVVGLPPFPGGGPSLGTWYSKKTARPVEGFLGPNAFKSYRVEIDYAHGVVYFAKQEGSDTPDMDLVGLTLRPEADGSYQVIGIARKDGKETVRGVEAGDTLLRVNDLDVKGASMGTVVDALRGRPGEMRTLVLDRGGRRVEVKARVEHLL